MLVFFVLQMDLSVEMQKSGHALQSADLPNFTVFIIFELIALSICK